MSQNTHDTINFKNFLFFELEMKVIIFIRRKIQFVLKVKKYLLPI